MTLHRAMAAAAALVERELDHWLPHADTVEGRLHAAMRYAALGPGKRMRPLLVVETARLFGVAAERAAPAAAAIELVHAYSLVHDDLPCMDDDDLRRGRATVHRAFDEATAVLTGDALLTLAFEVMGDVSAGPDAAARCELVVGLARAAGANGMVAGQAIDLAAETAEIDLIETRRLQALKTGALIGFSCEAGAILGRADLPARKALAAYAADLGLSFQITDDVLDLEGDEAAVGKKLRKDRKAGKVTFVDHLGLDGAKREAQQLAQAAAGRLASFGERADVLRKLAAFVVSRRS
ncbi:polyprenyl synthetase family protein [Desertibaculum subflavum]|uniref:polyprenyl synthetase family protein n=1 Tax=Desertibaculum subflavum TaxID=2268458 RepID=UPI0034D23B23